ncbi:MAG: arginine--tRNA ligase [Spirochaetales bacterium]|nr:arginine--tRNA ligase [Spirochaetales bacterium]
MTVKENVEKEIRSALRKLKIQADLPLKIEYAREEKFGDYACTVAMDQRFRQVAAEQDPLYRNPLTFAQALAGVLSKTNKFSNVSAVPPGFLNLSLADETLASMVRSAADRPAAYGRRRRKKDARRIIFEFVSANPTGPLNVVSARAAALGDSCCNLLEASGESVHREYYVNDHGNQVTLLGISCFLRYLEGQGIPLKFARKDKEGNPLYPSGPGLAFPAEGYHGSYLKTVARRIAKEYSTILPPATVVAHLKSLALKTEQPADLSASLNGCEAYCEAFGRHATQYFLKTQQQDLKKFRVRYDSFFLESTLHESGAVEQAADRIAAQTYVAEGKTLFRSTEYGDDKDRVIVREDGRPTYLLADIAYHKSKVDRGFTEIYDIWGPDHHGYIARLQGAMQALGFPADHFRVLIAQQVNMFDQGQPVVMSKRSGKLITMKDLLKDIPVDVLRYFFVMRSFDAHLDFDLSQARDTSEKNPFYYVAYAHARIRSIFQKARERGLEPDSSGDLPMTPERRRLFFLVARFPEEVADCARTLEPHRLVTFLYQMATALAQFYDPRENRIIEQDKIIAGRLLELLAAVAACLKNGLALLGMKAPDRMHREKTDASPGTEKPEEPSD